MSSGYYDDLEMRSAAARETELFAALRAQIGLARANAPYFAESLADIDPDAVADRAALAALPVLRKSDLVAMQAEYPPFGGTVATPVSGLERIFMSPGPIFEPQGRRTDYWNVARALYAAGFRRGELVHNAFSYHLTPAGMMLESAARALGCPVIPAGTGNTELQIQVIETLKPAAYTGVPDFLKILFDKAEELGRDITSLSKALVSGAALPASLRDELRGRGVDVLQCYATAELGLIAYETAVDGVPCEGMVVAEDAIVEIVRPGTGKSVPDGEVGEVVVTAFHPEHPLIRFATGDLSAVLPGDSPCGRTNMRIRGWMGRADQTAKIKGMFVRPEQIDAIARRHGEIRRARLVVARDAQQDVMTLRVEAEGGPELAERIAGSMADITKLRGTVEIVAPGSLANDGKVIDDTRPVE